jgi:hypothetical protein
VGPIVRKPTGRVCACRSDRFLEGACSRAERTCTCTRRQPPQELVFRGGHGTWEQARQRTYRVRRLMFGLETYEAYGEVVGRSAAAAAAAAAAVAVKVNKVLH